MGTSGDVAALISALGRLRPDGPTAARIAKLLGVTWAAEAKPSNVTSAFSPPPAAVLSTPRPSISRPPPVPEAKAPAPSLKTDALAGARLELFSVSETPVAARQLKSLDFQGAEKTVARELAFEPLLRPVATRAVVSAALARRVPTGPLDLPRVSELLARRAPLRTLPRSSYWGVAPWTRVLVDRGTGMTPFLRDATDFAARICAVACRDRAEVVPFWQTPRSAAVELDDGEEGAPAPPRPGTAVLAITDLGIAPSGAPVSDLFEHWLELLRELSDSASQLIVFVPYPSVRWPAPLAERLCLVPWDRRTSLADVRSALVKARARR